ncbi:DUF1186 domain-containing protein [Zoogloea sp.]|uniref:DUF1186 domain-containing protein n=1 Tax=Zoogloea sp. TaxID=49181 RepID=UPI0026272FED|nr:DUF1186 domain-containing protein [Zoogloea sp.]MDD3352173.1 DUF1186 domain-containing protein [Zoogloea sp.]
MSDIWSALRPKLEYLTNPLPLADLLQADGCRVKIAPLLVAELTALADDPTPAQADGYVLHLYVMLLLARWRETAAYRPLARLGHLDETRVDTVFGQLVHGSYGRCLASTCDGDLTPLTTLADDAEASRWSRAAALEAMTLAALEARLPPPPVIDFLEDFGAREADRLRTDPDAGEHFPLLDGIVGHLVDLGAAAALPQIREWFAAGLVDDSYLDLTQLERDILRSPDERLAALNKAGHGLIEDLMPEIELWPIIHHVPPVEMEPIPLGALRQPIVREETKVGRNDPCPCGSGRKYKKCHGAH